MIKNDEKITKEFCRGKTLFFQPKTTEEAIFIQKQFFEMGYEWGNTGTGIWKPEKCVAAGISLEGGKMWNESVSGAILCSSDQFVKPFEAGPPVKTERELILELFNQIAALTKKLDDTTRKVDDIHAEFISREMPGKPSLSGKKKSF